MSATSGSTLANPEQRIADLQRQLAEREAELAEAREQQTATAEVLQVINSSPGELAPVFEAILEQATKLCDAAFGVVWTYDRNARRYRPGVLHRAPAALAEFLSGDYRAARSDVLNVLGGASFLHILDAAESDGYRRGTNLQHRAMVDLGDVRTALAVPLRRHDTVLAIYRQEVRAFSDKQIALLQNFAAQAVIAMENARLLIETREALEQQTATAEVLGVINSSPDDLGPVFDAMLTKAVGLCEADQGVLRTFDGESFPLVAIYGRDPRIVEQVKQLGPIRIFGLLNPMIHGERVVHVPDVRKTATYRDDQIARDCFEFAGIRTWLGVALRKEDALLGAIIMFRREMRPFSDKQIALLQNFAAQAVIAMDNARLLTETREALEQQTATAEVLQVINSSPGDLAPVFDAILEKAHSLCGVEYGTLQLYDGEKFRILARRGFAEKVGQSWRDPYSVAPNSPLRALLEGEPLAEIPDVIAYHAETPNPRAEAAIAVGIRSVLFLPLRRDNLLMGMISAGRKAAKPFRAKEIALLENFAAQAVIAMENARLLTETREALEQQTATAEVLGVINSSPGDLTPVFDAVLDKALRLCGAAYGDLLRYDGGLFHLMAATHDEPQIAERRRPFQPTPDGLLDRLVAGEDVVFVEDVLESPGYRKGVGAFQRLVDAGGYRSVLSVALRKEGVLFGGISIFRKEVQPFSGKQIALLQNFAAQAVIAMENARLLGELHERTDQVAELNRGLEARVAEQVEELGRVGRLKRFLAPQLAELIVSQGDEKILESHRREIVVVFCDLRGYTAFTETAEPEEVLDFLREYHGALGPLVSQYEGTLDQFSGDGIMVFFNDPVPCPDPAERAVKMAMAMREAAGKLIAHWRERGRDLGFGAGIAQGYATLGQIGFSERSGYTAIGTVCNVAARLCAEAKDGQILLSQLVNVALKGSIASEQLGPLALKGLTQPVVAYNVPLAAIQPALRVIEGGPPSV
jgi:class 3 adenylate cyclase